MHVNVAQHLQTVPASICSSVVYRSLVGVYRADSRSEFDPFWLLNWKGLNRYKILARVSYRPKIMRVDALYVA